MKLSEMPVYPTPARFGNLTSKLIPTAIGGITLRQYFAGLALQGLIACPSVSGTHKIIAQASIAYADALLNELEREKV